jgi:pimeloyl-ACP methyl ester carboxylesterase
MSAASTTTAPQLDQPGTVAVAYREFGTGPDLLLVPGEHATMSWWGASLLASLAEQYTVVTLDLPGTGYSGPDPAARTVGSVADVVAGLSVSLGLTSPTVLGWGLGGEIALALAERHPGLPGRLVLADTSAGGPAAVRSSALDAALLASPTATYTELSAALFPPASLAARNAWTAEVARIPSDVETAVAVAESAALQGSAWRDAPLAAGLTQLRLPVLAVVGSLDAVFPPADTAQLVAGIRGAEELELPGVGYASIVEDEAQFVLALEKFTGGQAG